MAVKQVIKLLSANVSHTLLEATEITLGSRNQRLPLESASVSSFPCSKLMGKGAWRSPQNQGKGQD